MKVKIIGKIVELADGSFAIDLRRVSSGGSGNLIPLIIIGFIIWGIYSGVHWFKTHDGFDNDKYKTMAWNSCKKAIEQETVVSGFIFNDALFGDTHKDDYNKTYNGDGYYQVKN